MGTEIERKFLVTDLSALDGRIGVPYRQGYLSTDPARTVRIRRAGDAAYVTVKGMSVGAARPEFEYPIPVADAEAMLELCEGPTVDKTRYRIEAGALVWEVDVFAGANAGLVVAEVEIPSVDTVVTPPPWVGVEVTGDARYFNANLVRHPYRDWQD